MLLIRSPFAICNSEVSPLLSLLAMVVRENLVSGRLERTPEPMKMESPAQVEAWHLEGAEGGPIAPVYHLNALACSRFAPRASTVVDLGCGSGRFASYLARLRPDLNIVGIDLSAPMVEIGNRSLREGGLSSRVDLRIGDMTAFLATMPADTALINSLFALHHLPTLSHIDACLGQISAAVRERGCGFWVFDLARPRHRRTAVDYPDVFSSKASAAFHEDSTNSLIAAYSHDELRDAMRRAFGDTAKVSHSRPLPLYQAFWRGPATAGAWVPGDVSPPRSMVARLQFQALRAMLPGIPI